jgi:hypothetical protein
VFGGMRKSRSENKKHFAEATANRRRTASDNATTYSPYLVVAADM